MIRVLVIHEVRAICETIAMALRLEADVEVVGGATDIQEAATHLSNCDLALVNASLTTDSSARLVHRLRQLAPRVKMVLMGVARSPYAIFQCVQAGVAGYLFADSPLDDLLQSLQVAVRDDARLSRPHSAAAVSFAAEARNEIGGELEGCEPQSLTRREREVLSLVQQGLTNQEIAGSLVIELGTVKNHVHNILRKLNVSSRRDAVRVARLGGVTSIGVMPPGPWLIGSPHRAEAALERAAPFSPALDAAN